MQNQNLEKISPINILPEDILPHNKPMVLIDGILEINFEQNTLVSYVEISEDKIFFDKSINGISPLVGIEFMAQTIGCFGYLKKKQETPQIGFLLGTRVYNNVLEKFENGKKYTIKVHELYTDKDLTSFDCIIYNEEDKECQSATVNVYQGDDAINMLKTEKKI